MRLVDSGAAIGAVWNERATQLDTLVRPPSDLLPVGRRLPFPARSQLGAALGEERTAQGLDKQTLDISCRLRPRA